MKTCDSYLGLCGVSNCPDSRYSRFIARCALNPFSTDVNLDSRNSPQKTNPNSLSTELESAVGYSAILLRWFSPYVVSQFCGRGKKRSFAPPVIESKYTTNFLITASPMEGGRKEGS